MISQPIRAVYQNGQLRLLDPVKLSEGEEVQLMILSEEERELAALGDLLAEVPAPTGESMDAVDVNAVDEEELARQIEEAFRGQPPLSATIIEERRNARDPLFLGQQCPDQTLCDERRASTQTKLSLTLAHF